MFVVLTSGLAQLCLSVRVAVMLLLYCFNMVMKCLKYPFILFSYSNLNDRLLDLYCESWLIALILLHITWYQISNAWYLICYHLTPDTGMLSPNSWLSLLRGFDTDIMYTPEIIILYHTYSSCYYIIFNSRKPIIINIICNNWTTYTGTGKTDGYRYSFHFYGGHTNIVQLKLGILLGSHQVFSWGVLIPLLLLISCRVCH